MSNKTTGFRECEVFPQMLKKWSIKRLYKELGFLELEFSKKASTLCFWYSFDLEHGAPFAIRYKDHGQLTVKMVLGDLDTIIERRDLVFAELERRGGI